MSQEAFLMIQSMDMKYIGNQLVLQCAPVISGWKISNLLKISSENEELLISILRGTGLSYYKIFEHNLEGFFFIYRKELLEAYLNGKEARLLLKQEGYEEFALEKVFDRFQSRYAEYMERKEEFPHEIGILLGYPIEDVNGFIKNKGKNSLYTGYWKVYEQSEKKQRLFRQFDEAKEAMIYLIGNGVDIREIIDIYSTDRKNQKVG